MAVQWLGPCTSTAGVRSLVGELRFRVAQPKKKKKKEPWDSVGSLICGHEASGPPCRHPRVGGMLACRPSRAAFMLWVLASQGRGLGAWEDIMF